MIGKRFGQTSKFLDIEQHLIQGYLNQEVYNLCVTFQGIKHKEMVKPQVIAMKNKRVVNKIQICSMIRNFSKYHEQIFPYRS